MAGLIPQGFFQFLDINGDPLVGGTVGYFDPASPGTTKPIFADPGQTIPVSNPVTLDLAGRPATGGSEVGIWGTGQYLMTVRAFDGTLQWTALTQAPLALSDLTALQTQITNETNARIAADAAEANARAAEDTALQNEINTTNSNLAATNANLTAETNARIAEDTNLQNQINALTPGGGGSPNILAGTATNNASGSIRVNFSTPFAATPAFVATPIGLGLTAPTTLEASVDSAGATIFFFQDGVLTTNLISCSWIASRFA